VSEGAPIVFGRPWFGSEEEELVLQTIRSGWIGQGPLVDEFERRLAEYVGVPTTVAVASCTAALHLSLLAAGVGPGDEVVTTPFTFVATLNAIEHTGARAILVDIDESTLNLMPQTVEGVLGGRTRAAIPVHFAGRPLDTSGFADLSERHGIWVIEDAAHAVGAVAAGRRVGTCSGDRTAVCFSFYPNKNLATAEGGAVCARNGEFMERVRELRLHGLDSDAWNRYRSDEYRPSLARAAGFKYNWTDLQAAIALPQLERLEGFLATREYLAAEYDRALADIPGIRIVERPAHTLDERHALHLYQVIVDAPAPARDRVLMELRRGKIGAAVHYIGLHRHPFYRERFAGEAFPVADWASDRLLTLPLHPHMHVRDIDRVARTVSAAVKDVLG
jgi:dTDP-4-amino-4,6-dideoxygalactose transaminase